MAKGPFIQFNAAQQKAFAASVRQSSFENWVKSRGEVGDKVTASDKDGSTLIEDGKGNSTHLSQDFKTVTILSKDGDKLEVRSGDKNEITSITDANGLTVAFEYDEADKISKITRGDYGSYAFEYGRDGDITRLSYPDGTETNWLQHPTENARKIVDRNGRETIYRLDDYDRVTNVIDRNGHQTVLFYDEWDQPDAMQLPNGDRHEFRYDKNGGLKSLSINRKELARYTFTEDGSIQANFREGGELTLQTDKGRLMRGENPSGTIFFERDSDGRLLEEINPIGKAVFERDDIGRLAKLASNRGPETHYEYDDLNRVTAITAWGGRIELSYQKTGATTEIKWPNGVTRRQHGDQLGRPAKIDINRTGTTLAAWAYQYDALDRVIEESGQSGKTSYRYDDEGRLVEASNTSGKVEGFQLDANGNCLSGPSGAAQYNEINQIIQNGGRVYQHDLWGNVVQAGGDRFKFTANSKLEQAIVGGRQVKFTYDAAGRRLTKQTATERTEYVWAGQQLIAERKTAGGRSEIREYLWLPERPVPVAMRINGAVYALHTGRRNEVVMATDDGGNIVWQADYTAFGRADIKTSKIEQPWRLAGHYHDVETDLHYCSARYYDPDTGRYLSQDPLFLEGGNSNFYIYCGGDPLNFIDPTGEFIIAAIIIGAAIGAAIGAGVEYYRQKKSGEEINGWKVAGAGAVGGLIGAVGGGVGAAAGAGMTALIGSSAAATMGGGAAIGFVEGVAASLAEQCPYALTGGEAKSMGDIAQEALVDGLIGAGIGAITGGVGGFLARRSRKGLQEVSEAIAQQPKKLFRRDGRSPDEIFENGFQPWDKDANVPIEDYVNENVHSQFVGTSKVKSRAEEVNTQTGQLGYIYEINNPGHGVDVNEVYPNNPLAYEQEIAFPGGIDSKDVKGATPIDGNNQPTGEFVPNPNYEGD